MRRSRIAALVPVALSLLLTPLRAAATPSSLALEIPEAGTRLEEAVLAAQTAPDEVGLGGATAAKPRGSDIWRSAVLPGWGQWRAGYRELGFMFLAIDAAAWTTLFVSVGQGHMRRGSSEETAIRYAGIDLTATDEEFRKRVSDYPSSDEYNRLVVMRDAAFLYYGDFENYNRYIEQNMLSGDETWDWESEETWDRYRRERRTSESAFQRARFAGAVLFVNRVASTIVATRLKPKTPAAQAATPPPPPRTQVVWGVGAGADGALEPRIGCVYRF